MGREERIGTSEQRIVGIGWLYRKDIGTIGLKTTILQGIGHSLFIHQRTTPRIDENGTRLDMGERLSIDEVMRLRRQRAVQRSQVVF